MKLTILISLRDNEFVGTLTIQDTHFYSTGRTPQEVHTTMTSLIQEAINAQKITPPEEYHSFYTCFQD